MATCTESGIENVPLELIRTSQDAQCRVAFDESLAEEMSALIVGDFEFPAGLAFFDGDVYWLADGHYRRRAYELAHYDAMPCEVRDGNEQDALWHACAANKAHGLRRTNADKQRAVELALKHPRSVELSNVAIAQHVGVDEKTVRNYREKLEGTSEIPKSTERKGKDGRKQSTAGEVRSKSQEKRIAIQREERAAREAAQAESSPSVAAPSEPEPQEPDEQAIEQPAEASTPRGARSLPKLYDTFGDLLGKMLRCVDDIAAAGGGADKFTNKAHTALQLVRSTIDDHKRAHR